MTPLRRASLGALLGMLAVLFLHPATRPYYRNSLLVWGESQALASSTNLPENRVRLRRPRSIDEAAFAMLIASDRITRRIDINPDDLRRLDEAAIAAQRLEADNAFWKQMESVFALRRGDFARSVRAWMKAAACARWNDGQTTRLKKLIAELAKDSGAAMSWHDAVAYSNRSAAPAILIANHAANLLGDAGFDSDTDLMLRYATTENGSRIRDGARSNEIGLIGVRLIEMATRNDQARSRPTPRESLIARYELYNALADRGHVDQAIAVNAAHVSSESWLALSRMQVAEQSSFFLTIASAVAASLPGAFITVALLGGLLALIGKLVEDTIWLQRLFRVPVSPMLGVSLGLIAYQVTGFELTAIAIALCFAFFAFTPPAQRSNPPKAHGSAFHMVLAILAVLFTLVMLAFFMGMSPPGLRLAQSLNVPREFYGTAPLFIGLGALILGLVLVTAPAWGILEKVDPSRMAGTALREFGRGLLLGCLTLAVICGPAAVYFDRELGDVMGKIAENEPTYYLIQ